MTDLLPRCSAVGFTAVLQVAKLEWGSCQLQQCQRHTRTQAQVRLCVKAGNTIASRRKAAEYHELKTAFPLGVGCFHYACTSASISSAAAEPITTRTHGCNLEGPAVSYSVIL